MSRPLGYSLAQRVTEATILLVSLAVLARLLAPEAFGLFATAYASILLVERFCLSGAGAVIVRLERLDDGRASAAALFAAGAAAGGALLLGALAVALGRWSDLDPVLAAALLPLLIGRIALAPLRTVAEATLMRGIAFDTLCRIGIAAALANALTAIFLARHGAGAAALAVGALVESLVLSVGSAAAARHALVPLWRAPVAFRTTARSCAQVSLGGALTELGRVTAATASTAVLGTAATGIYDRARRVVGGFDDLLMNAVRPIVLPLLSERRRQGEGLRRAYLFKSAAISAVAWSFFGSLAMLAEPLVRVLLGEGWSAAVPVVRAFCLLGVAAPFHLVDGQFLIALEREREYLGIQFRSQLAAIGLILVAVPFGLVWLAGAVVAGKAIKALWTTPVLCRELDVSPAALGGAVLPSLVMAACVCGVVALLPALGGDHSPWRSLLVAVLAAVPAFVAPAAALRHPLWIEARAVGRRHVARTAGDS